MEAGSATRGRRYGLLEAETPLAPVQWSAILGSLVVLAWSVPGLILNPDFATGDSATSELVLGVDMNGWHAVSGFLVAVPGLFAALRRSWSGAFVLAAAASLIATGVWALFDTQPVAGLFHFPNNVGDALLHFGTSAIFVAGAVHYFLVEPRRSRGANPLRRAARRGARPRPRALVWRQRRGGGTGRS